MNRLATEDALSRAAPRSQEGGRDPVSTEAEPAVADGTAVALEERWRVWVVSDLLRQLPSTSELPADAWSIEYRNLAGPTGRDWTCIERYVVYRCHACWSFFEFQHSGWQHCPHLPPLQCMAYPLSLLRWASPRLERLWLCG